MQSYMHTKYVTSKNKMQDVAIKRLPDLICNRSVWANTMKENNSLNTKAHTATSVDYTKCVVGIQELSC